MSMRVLVLGGTGTLGNPVVRSLTDRGHRVRILTRNAGRAQQFREEGIEVLEGPSTNRARLEAAMDGCQAVHVSLPPECELLAVKEMIDLAEAGMASDLGRISYVSGTSVREENRWFDVIDVKMKAEGLLRDSGIPHTVFCPTWVMEVLPNFVRPDRGVVIEGRNPPQFHFFAATDFGRMVATSYEDDRPLGRRLFIHGPRSLTLPEAIRIFHDACYPETRLTRFRPWQAKAVAGLTRNRSLSSVARLIAYFDRTEEHGDPSEANALLGAPDTTLDQWIRRWLQSAFPK